ncbi:hypothetical protein JXZ74_16065, partial [Aeromonas media]
ALLASAQFNMKF